MALQITAKRIWEPIASLQNPMRVPYEGYFEDKRIGILFINPVSNELFPESVKLLNDLGYIDYSIKVQN